MKKKERKKNIEFTQLIVYQLGDDILCNIYIYIYSIILVYLSPSGYWSRINIYIHTYIRIDFQLISIRMFYD